MPISLEAIATALAQAGLLVGRRGSLPDGVTAIADDSRQLPAGGAFIAIRGVDRDGHDFLVDAASRGAAVAIVEDPARTNLPSLIVREGRRAAAVAAAAAYGFPARELVLIGVTGTNGKTTTVSILRHLLDEGHRRSASIGTLGVLAGSPGEPLEGGGGLTTPGPVELQRVFRMLVDSGISRVAIEVSSHALAQARVEGVEFDAVIYTNLSRDHLDYHGTMESYFAAKARLADALKPHGTLAVNLDEHAWTRLAPGRRRVGYSERVVSAEVHSENVRFHPGGSEWLLALGEDRYQVHLPLIGDFNVVNALAAAAGAWTLGIEGSSIAERLSTTPQVAGRLEVVHTRPSVLRDYAHTPDALSRAIEAVRPFVAGKLIVVFGCGGDRDRGKRPLMGAIAAEKADIAIVTSDNPRTEDPEAILDEIESAMQGVPHERIEDRRAAIARALEIAEADDVILLAGKGHETYQVRGTEKHPFDEKEIVAALIAEHASAGSWGARS